MKASFKSLLALMLTATMALSSSAPAIAVSNAGTAEQAVSPDCCSCEAPVHQEEAESSESNKAAAVSAMEQQINDELLSETLTKRMNSAVSVTTATTTTTNETITTENTAPAGQNNALTEKTGDTSQKQNTQLLPYGISMKELHPEFATGDNSVPGSLAKSTDVTRNMGDYYAAKYGEEYRNLPRAMNFPSSVDNSQSEYFPEVDSQGQIGSCVCWSQVYYQFTYTFNKSRGIKTTKQNTFSPMFTYSHICYGVDGGSVPSTAYSDMTKFGCATLQEVPYGDDYISLSATGNIFRNAANRRVKEYHSIPTIGDEQTLITSVDDSDLEALKTVLANGDIISFTSGISNWRLANLTDPGIPGINEGAIGDVVLLCNDGSNGGHRMTIVGYNDKIWTDLNNNSRVDSGEMGAFKIVNSWGKGYGTQGFYWVPYDTLNYKSVVENSVEYPNRKTSLTEFAWIEVMPVDYEPRYFISLTLSTKERNDKNVTVTGKWANSTVSTSGVPGLLDSSGTYHSFDNSQNETVGVFVWDLYFILNKLGTDRFEEIEWSVEYKDTKANSRPLTVKDTYIYDEKDPSVKYRPNEFPLTLENSSKTIVFNQPVHNNAIIYYRGYKDPVIRYRLGNTWSQASGERMKYTTEEYGYVDKYVVPLGSYSTADVMFGDGKGRWDTNGGSYFKAVKGINRFITGGVGEPMTLTYTHSMDDVSDLYSWDSYNATTTGGYAPYKYKMEIMDLNEGKIYFSNNYGNPSSNSVNVYGGYYTFKKESKFKITVYSMDVAGSVVSKSHTVIIKDMPLTITSFKAAPEKTVYQPGEEITLTSSAINDKMDPGNCNYSFVIYKDGIERSRKSIRTSKGDMYKNTATNSMTFTASEAGKYTAVVSRTDKYGDMGFASLDFEVAAPAIKLSSVTVIPETNIGAGSPITVKAAASGGSGAISYSYSLLRYGAVIQTSDSTANSGVLTMPAEAGPCTILVTAKDSAGMEASLTKDIWVNPVYVRKLIFPSTGLYNGADIKIGHDVMFDNGLKAENYIYTAIKGSSQTVLKTNADKTATLNVKDAGEYTIRLDIKSGDKLLSTMSKKLTLTENPTPPDPHPNTYKITVGVISYIENEGNQGNYKLHYWNNSGFVGDAALQATGKTATVSLGNEYWNGSGQSFKLYEAYVPKAATGYKFHIGDRWFGADGVIASNNTVYIFNYSGDKALYTIIS